MIASTRTVYLATDRKGRARAFLTPLSAARCEAKRRYFEKYECECCPGDDVTPPWSCGCHDEKPRAIRERLARFILRSFRRKGGQQ